ncbi:MULTISPECIES: vWA domain-containing protein [Anaerostipes]|nr:vWA domain-containing protein [Anaerostipes sp.]MCI5623230.1 VWA domain-containing protein [Anaerostipes sp.]MDY2725992.1 vWA domain-containing protein [Anaerostipes faecalis]
MGKKKITGILVVIALSVIGIFVFQRNHKIHAMEKKFEESQERFNNYYLNNNDGEYKRLLANFEYAISRKNIDGAKTAQKELDEFEKEIVKENKTDADNDLKKLKESDTSKAFDNELKSIENYEKQMQKYIDDNQFKNARKVKIKWEKLLASIQIEYDNLAIQVVQVDTSQYPKVKIYLDIRDKTTDKVPSGLKKQYFYLKEKTGSKNFERQTIIKASQLDQKEALNINMVADVSASMNGSPMLKAKNIMQTFLNSVQFSIGDQVELTTFSTGVQTAVSFTKDKTTLDEKIQNLTTDNMTSLYDALFAAVNTTAVQNGAKCVVAFTDGADNYSYCKPEDVIEIAKKYKIPVFIIGIGSTIKTYDVQRICTETGGFYRSIDNIDNMAEIYNEIYRQQKELYLVEYKVSNSENKTDLRNLMVEYQDRKIGGKQYSSYKPDTLMSASASTSGLSEPEKMMHNYLNAFIKAINEHNFSYIEKYMVKDGPVYKENKEYIKKDITEELLSYNFLKVSYPSKNTCIIHMQETYKIQNQKEPLHMRTIDSYYKLMKNSNGEWQVHSYPKDMTVVKKIKY